MIKANSFSILQWFYALRSAFWRIVQIILSYQYAIFHRILALKTLLNIKDRQSDIAIYLFLSPIFFYSSTCNTFETILTLIHKLVPSAIIWYLLSQIPKITLSSSFKSARSICIISWTLFLSFLEILKDFQMHPEPAFLDIFWSKGSHLNDENIQNKFDFKTSYLF